jgi:Zn-finger nucleic acid-binding protein
MNCPVCNVPLAPMAYEGIEVMSCSRCEGCFLNFLRLRAALAGEQAPRSDAERSAALAKSGTAASAGADERDALPCPVCQAPMRRYIHENSSGVWIDACGAHGAWLDAGELQQLEAWTEATRTGGGVAAPTRVTPEAAANVPAAPANEESTDDWLTSGDDAEGERDTETPLLLSKLTAHLRGLGRD